MRTRLDPNFPVNRENTGKICDFQQILRYLSELEQCLQRATGEFPKITNRENFQANRVLIQVSREIQTELGLELMAIIGSDFTNGKRELLDDMIDKIDGIHYRLPCRLNLYLCGESGIYSPHCMRT